jgi:putative transposase
MRKPYPTDLSDAEWNYIQPHMPAPKGHGRPRVHDLREILNAVFYVLKSGCQWRLLPHDFPRWPTVYHYFREWRIDGTWERINRAIRERLRVRLRRDPQPSAGVVDSQGRSRVPQWAVKSAATMEESRSKALKASPARGHRRLRTQSQLHSAKVMNWDGIKTLLRQADTLFPRLKHLWVDAGYRGEDRGKDWALRRL